MRWFLKLMMALMVFGGLSSKASAETYTDRWCINNTFYADFRECYPSAQAFIDGYWAFLKPQLNYVDTSNSTYWHDNRAALGPCEVRWPGPPPVIYCMVTHYDTQHTYENDQPLEFTPWYGWFGLAMLCGDASGSTYAASQGTCVYVYHQEKTYCDSCILGNARSVGNPITPLDGLKHQTEQLLRWGRGYSVTASYNYLRESLGQRLSRSAQPGLGTVWFTNHHKVRIYTEMVDNAGANLFLRPDGTWRTFSAQGWVYSRIEKDLQPRSNNAGGYWYYDTSAEAIENYVSASITSRYYGESTSYIDGRKLTYLWANLPFGSGIVTVLQAIEDDTGRRVGFSYETDPVNTGTMRVVTMTDPAGGVYGFSYGDKGQLTTIQYPDQTTRQYKYEVDGKPWLISSLLDESGSTYGRYGYDSEGRATSTKTGTNGEQWSVEWTQAPVVTAVDTLTGSYLYRALSYTQPTVAQLHGPDGYEETLTSTQLEGATFMASLVQPSGSGSASATLQYDRDGEGNITRRVDANGLQSCHAFVGGRKAESSRVEGLASGATCSTVLAANALMPIGARKVSSLWHPVWRKQVRIAEPNRITTLVYNGQPDPTNGNVVASCTPSTAKLPDNTLIVVLCKSVEEATTDATGALGFNATAQAGVVARTSSWTYDAQGHVLTEMNPLGKVTTNEYYNDTTADHWTGDLKSSTDAAGHVTNYLRYNALGQVLEMVDPNGISTVYTYDVRSRVTSVTQGDQTTSYTYWPTGLVKLVTQSDGSTVSYDYDDAHRLVAVADNLGNRIQYTLDQRGNRTSESVQDPAGALSRSLGRVFDALSRTQKTTGGE